jgi:hypothetical protein
MAIRDYSIEDLAKIRRDFDLNSDEGVAAAEQIVAEQAGESYGDVTPAETLAESNPLTVDEAAGVMGYTKSVEFKKFMQVITDRIEFFDAKSKNLKLSRDERDSFRNMFLGGEQIKLAIAEFVTENRLRLQNASTEERATMGANAKAKIGELTADAELEETTRAPLRYVRRDGVDYLE